MKLGMNCFLIYAEENADNPKKITCPGARCGNLKQFSLIIIRGHLYDNGFSLGYVDWIWHGQQCSKTINSSVSSNYPNEPNAISEIVDVYEPIYNNLGDDYDLRFKICMILRGLWLMLNNLYLRVVSVLNWSQC